VAVPSRANTRGAALAARGSTGSRGVRWRQEESAGGRYAGQRQARRHRPGFRARPSRPKGPVVRAVSRTSPAPSLGPAPGARVRELQVPSGSAGGPTGPSRCSGMAAAAPSLAPRFRASRALSSGKWATDASGAGRAAARKVPRPAGPKNIYVLGIRPPGAHVPGHAAPGRPRIGRRQRPPHTPSGSARSTGGDLGGCTAGASTGVPPRYASRPVAGTWPGTSSRHAGGSVGVLGVAKVGQGPHVGSPQVSPRALHCLARPPLPILQTLQSLRRLSRLAFP
jgi:hypothetical protein